MDQLHTMRVFVAVAEHLSFAAAARALHMSRPAVTRAIAALEDRLGATLLVRTTRTVALSQVGARYMKDCKRILEAAAEADAAVSGSYTEPSGLLTLTAPVMFGQMHVMPVVRAFLDAEPRVCVRALLLDRVVRLVDEGMDVAVRIGHLRDTQQMAVKVGTVTLVVVGAPSYVRKHGAPPNPEALDEHALITHTGALHKPTWRFGEGDGQVAVPIASRVMVNQAQAALELAIDGFGLARALSYQAGPALADGRLLRLLTDWEPPPLPVHLVYPAGARLPARTRAFLDFATSALRARAASQWSGARDVLAHPT